MQGTQDDDHWWDKNSANAPPKHPPPSGSGPTPPPVPGGGTGSGAPTSVHTPSMDLFATNIGAIIPIVNHAITRLGPVHAEPGAFFHADQMRNKIQGSDGTGGAKASYAKVLNDLVNALTALESETRAMSKKYKNIDELNTLSANDLNKNFSESSGYFGSMITDGYNGK